jgi:hypothetical protein
MALCSGIKADGGRCGAQAMRNSAWCIGHDPEQAQARRRRASKGGKRGGRGRPIVAAADVAEQIQDLTNKVLAGNLDRADAAVCGQLLNVKLRALEVGRKLREAEELEQRLEELERVLQQRGDSRYGA